MSHKKKFIITFLVLLVVAIGFILYARADYVGICDQVLKERTCLKRLYFIVGPIFTLSIGLAPFFLILAFLPEPVFRAWRKFALWYIPIAAIVLIFDTITATHGNLMNFDTELTNWFLVIVFVLTSVCIIITKSVNLNRSNTSPTDQLK